MNALEKWTRDFVGFYVNFYKENWPLVVVAIVFSGLTIATIFLPPLIWEFIEGLSQ